MAELAMLADIQRTVYPEEITYQLHVMAQGRESSPVIDRHSNHSATSPTKKHPLLNHKIHKMLISHLLIFCTVGLYMVASVPMCPGEEMPSDIN